VGGCGWFFMLFVVVYYGVEDMIVNVCVYVELFVCFMYVAVGVLCV
jgi:hypothetical protein